MAPRLPPSPPRLHLVGGVAAARLRYEANLFLEIIWIPACIKMTRGRGEAGGGGRGDRTATCLVA